MSAFGATHYKHVFFTRQSNQCRFWQLIRQLGSILSDVKIQDLKDLQKEHVC